MKNLDIEKLERQNIYKVPDHFFEEMQMKVLSETAPKKEAKIIKMNWAYSAAAAVALIFGISFFVNQDNNNTESIATTKPIASNESKSVNNSLSDDKPKNEGMVSNQIEGKNLTDNGATNQKQSSASNDNIEPNKSSLGNNAVAAQNPDVQVDQILANFTSSDLADLSKNTEQDVYLDLYN